MAFLHSPRDDGRYDLWVGSTSSDNAEQLTNTRDVSSVAWSPTGDWIAYVKDWSEVTLEGEIILIRPERGRRDAPHEGRRTHLVPGRLAARLRP